MGAFASKGRLRSLGRPQHRAEEVVRGRERARRSDGRHVGVKGHVAVGEDLEQSPDLRQAMLPSQGVHGSREVREHMGKRLREVALCLFDAEETHDRVLGQRETVADGVRAPVGVDQRRARNLRDRGAHGEREAQIADDHRGAHPREEVELLGHVPLEHRRLVDALARGDLPLDVHLGERVDGPARKFPLAEDHRVEGGAREVSLVAAGLFERARQDRESSDLRERDGLGDEKDPGLHACTLGETRVLSRKQDSPIPSSTPHGFNSSTVVIPRQVAPSSAITPHRTGLA